MTKEEYLALAEAKYAELQGLQKTKDFYEYEKRFDEIWTELGRQVIGSSISKISQDRRKKKDVMSLRKNRDSQKSSFQPSRKRISD